MKTHNKREDSKSLSPRLGFQKVSKAIGKPVAFALVVVLAMTLIGGFTAAVLAAIPDGNGTIHGCYGTGVLNKGNLRVVDSDAGQTCKSNEASLNWNQNVNGSATASPVLHDANDATLGVVVGYSTAFTKVSQMQVYNSTLKRDVPIFYNDQYQLDAGDTSTPPEFTSSDCSGQPYLSAGDPLALTSLIRWNQLPADSSVYALVPDGTNTTLITVGSYYSNDTGGNTKACVPGSGVTDAAYPLTVQSSLPFATPIATPFHF